MKCVNTFLIFLAFMAVSLIAEKNFSNGVSIQESSPIKIDGSFTDWESNKAKAVISKPPSSKFDIEKMYMGDDDKFVYFAFKFSGDLKKYEGAQVLEVIFDLDKNAEVGLKEHEAFPDGLTISGGDLIARFNVEYGKAFNFEVFREVKGKLGLLKKSSGENAKRLGNIAQLGNALELRIRKAAFTTEIGGQGFDFDEPLVTVLTTEKEKYSGVFESQRAASVESNFSAFSSPKLIVAIILGIFYIFCFAKIFKRAGLSPMTSVAMLVPPLGFSILNYSKWTLRRKIFRLEDQIAAHYEEE